MRIFIPVILISLLICGSVKAQHKVSKVKPPVKKTVATANIIKPQKPNPIIDFTLLLTLRNEYPGTVDSAGNLLPAATSIEKLHLFGDIQNLQGIEGFTGLKELVIEGRWRPPLIPTSVPVILPALPASLIILKCAGDSIHELPPLPKGLLQLDCSGNYLTVLPELPPTLQELNCAGNRLTSVPALPASLTKANLSWNRLNSCPQLPEGLTYLGIFDYNLTAVPNLPSTLRTLIINFDMIKCVPNSNNLLKIYEHDYDKYETRLKICETNNYGNENNPVDKPVLIPMYFYKGINTGKNQAYATGEPITGIRTTLNGARIVAEVKKKGGFGIHNIIFTVSYTDSRTGHETTSGTYEVPITPTTETVSQEIFFGSGAHGTYTIRAYKIAERSNYLIAEEKFSILE